MPRAARLRLVAALYCTQNLSLGFFSYAFLTIAQARGVPLALIGASGGIATILVLKFLWAPLIDRYGSRRLGHYRGWLLGTQSALVVGSAALALFDPAESFAVLLALFAALFTVAATQDVAADAAATRLLTPAERGIGNGFQSAGSSVAQVVGGGVVLLIYGAVGWQAAALALAAFSAVALPFVIAWDEDSSTAAEPRPAVTVRTIVAFFNRAGVMRWAFVLLPLYSAGFTVTYNLVRPILVDSGWEEARIGLFVVIGGSAFGIAAGVAGGALIAWLGRRPALMWLGALQVVGAAGTLPLALGETGVATVLAVVALSNGAFAAAAAVLYTISMDLTRPASAGTDFTIFTTVSGLVMAVAGGGGMVLADLFGYASVIVGSVILAAAGLTITALSIGPVLRAGQATPTMRNAGEHSRGHREATEGGRD